MRIARPPCPPGAPAVEVEVTGAPGALAFAGDRGSARADRGRQRSVADHEPLLTAFFVDFLAALCRVILAVFGAGVGAA